MCTNEELKAKHLADIRSRCRTDDQAAQVFYLDTTGYNFCDERPKCIEQVFTSEVWMYCMRPGHAYQVHKYARVNGYGHIDYFDARKAWAEWQKRQPKTLANPKGIKSEGEPRAIECYSERILLKVELSDGKTLTVTKFLDILIASADERYRIIPPVSSKTRQSVIKFVELHLESLRLA